MVAWTVGRRDGDVEYADVKQVFEHQFKFRQPSAPEETIRDVLRNFKAVDNIPALVVNGGSAIPNDEWHIRALDCLESCDEGVESWYHVNCLEPEMKNNDLRSFEMICETIHSLEFSVTNLELGNKGSGSLVNPVTLCPLVPKVSAFNTPSTLRLVWNQRMPSHTMTTPERYRLLKEEAVEFVGLLQGLNNLETLSVTRKQEGFHDVHTFESIAAAVCSTKPLDEQPLQRIRDVDFDGFTYDWRTVLDFVRARRSTLKRLVMSKFPYPAIPQPSRYTSFEGESYKWRQTVLQVYGAQDLQLQGGFFWAHDELYSDEEGDE